MNKLTNYGKISDKRKNVTKKWLSNLNETIKNEFIRFITSNFLPNFYIKCGIYIHILCIWNVSCWLLFETFQSCLYLTSLPFIHFSLCPFLSCFVLYLLFFLFLCVPRRCAPQVSIKRRWDFLKNVNSIQFSGYQGSNNRNRNQFLTHC